MEDAENPYVKEKRAREKIAAVLGSAKFKDFQMMQTVGTGTFGRVRVSKHIETGMIVALKALKKSEVIRLKQVEHINNEKAILAMINHPFICKMYNTFQVRGKNDAL